LADLLAFATDVSNGDAKVVKAVSGWLKNPPQSAEEIGFYGDPEDMPPEWRRWLATVSLLAERDHITGFEDKYSDEFVDVWANRGLLAFDDLPQHAQEVWSIIADGVQCDDDGNPDVAQFEVLWNNYAAATAAVDDAFRAGGKVLVSIDATEGDTLFFAALEPAVADRWIGTGFAAVESYGTVYEIGVRPPLWGRLWEHLLYAMDDVPEDFEERGLPPGLAAPGALQF
jgi:hypothetical protein